MDYKALIEELCADLQENISLQYKRPFPVELRTYIKAEGDWGDVQFAEIWVDRKCIFRESILIASTAQPEEFCLRQLLKSTFDYGVMSSRDLILNREKS